MVCKHEHLRTVGDDLFCKDCGEHLPIEFLTGGNKPAEEKTDKPAPKKRTAKKAE